MMKSFKDYLDEDAPLNTSSGPGVNMNPTGRSRTFRKLDHRSRFDTYKMYRRALGLKSIPSAIRRQDNDDEDE